MNFLFWNIRGRDIREGGRYLLSALHSIIEEESIDVVALAEYEEYSEQLDAELVYKKRFTRLKNPSGIQEKVELFYNPQKVAIKIKHNKDNTTALQLIGTESGMTLNGFFCHLPSKLRRQPADQRDIANDFMDEVRTYEKQESNDKTFICGDFNMCPYEEGMINSKCFHSIMDADVVRNYPSRNFNRKTYTTFYNPMWGLSGDLGRGDASGTYYGNQYETNEYFWYMFDQIIIRPSLLNYFDSSKLRIVAKGETYSLVDDQARIQSRYSDHLPIRFTLNF